jgi:hypothetical protein
MTTLIPQILKILRLSRVARQKAEIISDLRSHHISFSNIPPSIPIYYLAAPT